MTSNGDTSDTTDSVEDAGKHDETPSDQPTGKENTPPANLVQVFPNDNREPVDSLQIPLKVTLPAVYSDDAITSSTEPPSAPGSYLAALVFIASVIPVPFVALVLTSAIYILPPHSLFDNLANAIPWLPRAGVDIICGFAITILLWLVFSIPFRFATTRENAQQYSSHHISSHLMSLKTTFRSIQAVQRAYNGLSDAEKEKVKDTIAGTIIDLRNGCTSYYDASAEKVRECLATLDVELQKGGLHWLDGSGYLNAWNLIHRAEEALICTAPVEDVFKEALHDDAAIDGSGIPTRDDSLNMLRLAVRKLSPAAGIYMKPPAVEPSVLAANSNNPDPSDPRVAMEARNAIRVAKLTLGEFRDALWDGLVRNRNMLVLTSVLTGILSYVLLCVVLLLNATTPEIQAALIFYLVGAFTGMFGRLITESQTDTAIDDYGLTQAREVLTPLIAGLAALAGVFLLAILSVNLLQSPTVKTSSLPSLQDIYSIAKNPQGLLSAAIFGLTPNLFISVLQQQADAVKVKLKNSSASNQGTN